jgi:hypothetical protein
MGVFKQTLNDTKFRYTGKIEELQHIKLLLEENIKKWFYFLVSKVHNYEFFVETKFISCAIIRYIGKVFICICKLVQRKCHI